MQRSYPFLENTKPNKLLKEEDAFMHEHGGRGAVAIFKTVTAIGAFFEFPSRVVTKALRRMRNKKAPTKRGL